MCKNMCNKPTELAGLMIHLKEKAKFILLDINNLKL